MNYLKKVGLVVLLSVGLVLLAVPILLVIAIGGAVSSITSKKA